MTTRAHLRKTALSLPETAERALDSGAIEYTTAERRFALARDDLVELHLQAEDAARVLDRHPTAEPLAGGGVRVPLGDMNGQQLNHWLRRAWLSHAPKRLAEQVAAADTAVAGAVGDLPRAIGGPATRALVGAGITTLAQVAERTEAELLALHGVGPRAIRILKETLAAKEHEPGG